MTQSQINLLEIVASVLGIASFVYAVINGVTRPRCDTMSHHTVVVCRPAERRLRRRAESYSTTV